jgi:TPR repeat protein
MVATAHPISSRQRAGATRGLAVCLALVVLSLAASAKADALSDAERAFVRRDYAHAAPVLLLAAERGLPEAQTYIGYMYQNGLGVPRDYAAAASWLNQAAQQDEPTAQFLLGLLFDKGYGVPQDWVQAEVWLNLAASQASAKERDYWARIRDAVAEKLTLDQFAEAQQRAFDWTPIMSRRTGSISARY